MIKLICIFIVTSFMVFGLISKKKQNNENLIVWSSKKLTWSDFKGEMPKNSGTTIAETQCRIKITDSRWVDDLPKYKVKCFFDKSKSWTSVDDLMTLKHEQLHFDIYELYTRKLRKRFEEMNRCGEKNPDKYNKAYRELVNIAILKNTEYDSEVYFNDKKQLAWIDNIAMQLEKLKEYEYVTDEI